MKFYTKRLRKAERLAERVAALEDYVEYLRQQGETGMDQVRRAHERRDNNEHV